MNIIIMSNNNTIIISLLLIITIIVESLSSSSSPRLITSIKQSNSLNIIKLISFLSIINYKKNVVYGIDNNNELLGVDKSGLLKPCISSTTECISSQDDRPFCFSPPWGYEGNMVNAKKKLILQLNNIKECKILYNSDDINDNDRYIKAQFIDISKNIDETEFYFTPNDYTIQFRSYRKINNPLNNQFTFLNNNSNRNRLEKLRLLLGFEEIEVLRNRKSIFLFGESPFDSFGPSTIEFEENIDNNMNNNNNNNIVSEENNYPIWEIKLT